MSVKTIGLAAAGVAALGLAFASGVAVGGSGDAPHRPLASGPGAQSLRLANADLRTASSCPALLDWYVDRGLDQVGPYGWGGGPLVYATAEDTAAGKAVPAPVAGVPSVDRVQSDGTGTNTQEAGVDEADLVKTDGRILARVHDDGLRLYDVTGEEPTMLSATPLGDVMDAEILLAGDTVVVVGADRDQPARSDFGIDPGVGATRMIVLDVADPSAPTITETYGYDAALVAARQHDSVVRLTLSSGLPSLNFVQPGEHRTEQEALRDNERIVRASTLEDWLPQLTSYGDDGVSASEDLLGCDDVALPDDDGGLGTLAIVGFDTSSPDTWSASAVATDSRIAYESADRLVLATDAWGWGGGCCSPRPVPSGDVDHGTTRLYSFALDGTSATYVASGEVEGQIADRWSMDEAGGVLRVAVGATEQTGNFNSVLTLREDGSALVEAGRVDKLGIDEQIKSVRWFDDLAIVVTFRQSDPLYAIDLTDAERPRLMGELKIPGYSEYLHPLGAWRMIGVGQDANADGSTTGAQAALFDVRDLSSPRRLATVGYGKDSYARAGADPRQFTYLPEQRVALTVVSRGWTGTTGWVSVLHVDDGTLANRMVEVEYGTDVDQVRLVPLPGGRVVLVTGDAVSFFEVS